MGYLSSIVGKPMKWLGGAAALYGGYKLASQNGSEIADSFGGAAESLSEGGNEFDAIYGFLDSTREGVQNNPQFGKNLGTAGKGLAAGLIGAYLDGSLSSNSLPERYLEDNNVEEEVDEGEDSEDEDQEDSQPFDMDYTQVGAFEDPEGERYMMLRGGSEEDGSLYAVPFGDLEGYEIGPGEHDFS